MPFDYQAFSAKCDHMTVEELHREWNNYTRHVAGGATSTTLSVGFAPFTLGASLVGIGLSAPRIHNARKKRAIIEAHLQAKGTTHNTRKRDVAGPMALSTAIGGLTLGLAPAGADVVGSYVAENALHAVASNPEAVKIAAHVALEGAGTAAEHKHSKNQHQTALQKLKNSVATQEKTTQLSSSGSAPLYPAQVGMMPPLNSPPYSISTAKGPNYVHIPPPPSGYPSYTAVINQEPGNAQVYSSPPGYPSYTPGMNHEPTNMQIYSPPPGYAPYPAQTNQGPNGNQYSLPPPVVHGHTARVQQGFDSAWNSYDVDQQGTRDLASSSGYPYYTAAVQQLPNAIPYFAPPPGHSTHGTDQQVSKDIYSSSGIAPYTSDMQHGPNLSFPQAQFACVPSYPTHSTGTPQGHGVFTLPPPPPRDASVTVRGAPNSFRATPAAQPSGGSIYPYSYQAGYLAPPAYDVNEVSDGDDDPNMEEIESLLRDLKASKPEPTVTVTEITA